MRRITMAMAMLALGCSEPTGALTVEVSGEEAAVEGFGADDFADGWSVRFDALVVSLGDFDLHGSDGEHAALGLDPVIVDLTRGDTSAWTLEGVSARRWQDVRYRVRPATSDARVLGAVDPTLRQRMIDEGLSMYVEATATRDAAERRIRWGFRHDVAHSRCEGADGTEGIVVRSGAPNVVQITLHWDHLFFDSLVVDEAGMRFDAIDAVEGDPITLQALSAQRLADLRGVDGGPLRSAEGSLVVYDPGSAVLSEPTLRGMIEAAASGVGHLDGEGHCEYQRQR